MVISPRSAADNAKMMPPSTCAVAVSRFTTSPQSTAAYMCSTFSRPATDTETCATSATMVPKLSQMAMPRPSPAGSGVPHPDIAAAFSSAALKRGCWFSIARRNSNGSLPAACAISSMNDSLKKPCCEFNTDRHCPSRIGCAASFASASFSGIA